MMKIIDMTKHNNRNHYNGLNPKKYITIHQTGNTNKGSDAVAHGKLIMNGYSASWHYTVDDKNIVKHFNEDIQCWHCGDGLGKGNTQSIGVELCVNGDGDYIKTIKNGVKLVSYLMNKYSIPITNIVQHNYWNGKNCPSQIRAGKEGITWNKFIELIKNEKGNEKEIIKNEKGNKKEIIKKENSKDDYINKIALDVIRGQYGNGAERKEKLYNTIQTRVNEILKNGCNKDDYINKIALDVIRGQYGNGAERKEKLYNTIQTRVNEILKG